ncbi:hypothetical protein GIB67_010097, partial [Kingdonia uniflora]
MDEKRATAFGLMKIDEEGRIIEFAEKPKGEQLKAMKLFACKVFPVTVIQNLFAGKFRHLPVVENGEVIALLDIAKCLYDAIARMESAAEKGKTIAAAVEGVERHWGNSVSVWWSPNSFIDNIFKVVSPTDSVLSATQKMLELRLSAAVVTVENKPRRILTSKDLLMWVIAQNLSPESTLVEK